MATAGFNGTFQIGGITMIANSTRTGVGSEEHEPPLPAGIAATLTTRTSDTAGVLTLPDGHGLITGDYIAIFWTDPTTLVPMVMYGFATVISGDSCTFTSASGQFYGVAPASTVLPIATSSVVVSTTVVSETAVQRNNVTMIGVDCNQPAIAIFATAVASIYVVHIPVGQSIATWDAAASGQASNPLTSNPTQVVCYNGGLAAATLQYGMLLAS